MRSRTVVGLVVATVAFTLANRVKERDGKALIFEEAVINEAEAGKAVITVNCNSFVNGELTRVVVDDAVYTQFGERLGSGELGDVYALGDSSILKVPKLQESGPGCNADGDAPGLVQEVEDAKCLQQFLKELGLPDVRSTPVTVGKGVLSTGQGVGVLVKPRVFGATYQHVPNNGDAAEAARLFFRTLISRAREGGLSASIKDLKLSNVMWGATAGDPTERLYLIDVTCFHTAESAETYSDVWYQAMTSQYDWRAVFGLMDPNDTPAPNCGDLRKEQLRREREEARELQRARERVGRAPQAPVSHIIQAAATGAVKILVKDNSLFATGSKVFIGREESIVKGRDNQNTIELQRALTMAQPQGTPVRGEDRWDTICEQLTATKDKDACQFIAGPFRAAYQNPGEIAGKIPMLASRVWKKVPKDKLEWFCKSMAAWAEENHSTENPCRLCKDLSEKAECEILAS